MDAGDSSQPRRRIWVQRVNVEADSLETRVKAARARGLEPWQETIANGVLAHLKRARDAANRRDPKPRTVANWWRGTLTDTAYRNLHAARVQMVDLLSEDELPAEVDGALARAELTHLRDDPRRISLRELMDGLPPERVRPHLRRVMDDSYQMLDGKHAQLRSFRNILLLTALIVALLVGLTIVIVSWRPTWLPLCFPNEVLVDGATGASVVQGQNCPTSSGDIGPSHGDVLIVALLGALGGALTAAISIRNLKGTSTPYDVPVALAMLKVPLGAFTAILALVAIQGDFVPGLSVLDSQEQILAYALVFGFSQQLLTRLLDQRAQTLLDELPGGDSTEVPPSRLNELKTLPRARVEPADRNGHRESPSGALPSTEDHFGDDLAADLPGEDVEVVTNDEPALEPEADDEQYPPIVADDEVAEPDPLTDQGDDFQDDVVSAVGSDQRG